MDLNKTELAAVEQTFDQVHDDELRQLAEMQLALVGGGIGETIL